MKILTLVICIGVGLCSNSQNDLSLLDAIKLGLNNNFDIQLAQQDVFIAKINNSYGEAGMLPKISLSLGQNNNLNDQSKNPTSFIKQLMISNSFSGGVELNWTLFNGFSAKASKRKLEQLEAQSEGNAAVVVENAIHAIVLAYYSVKLQQKKLLVLQESMDISRLKWKYQLLKEELGTSSSLEAIRFENAMYSDSIAVVNQELSFDNAVKNLNLLMAVDVQQRYNLTDDFKREKEQYTIDALGAKMESNNQNLKNQFISREIFQSDVKIARAGLYPTIGFNIGGNTNTSRYTIGDNPSISGTTFTYYAGLTLNFTLFNGGKVKRALQAVKIQNQITELKLNQLKSKLKNELSIALDLYNARIKILELTKKSAVIAKRNMDAAQEKFNAGLINSFEFRDVQNAFSNAGVQAWEAAYNVIDSRTDLTRLVGGLISEYQE